VRTLLSTRREKFYRLVQAANRQSSTWLAEALQDKTRNNGFMSAVARLAALRVLVFRNTSGAGLCYAQRKRLVRTELGI
jgi:hypothetical protein